MAVAHDVAPNQLTPSPEPSQPRSIMKHDEIGRSSQPRPLYLIHMPSYESWSDDAKRPLLDSPSSAVEVEEWDLGELGRPRSGARWLCGTERARLARRARCKRCCTSRWTWMIFGGILLVFAVVWTISTGRPCRAMRASALAGWEFGQDTTMFAETPTLAGERDRKPGPILAYSHNDEMQNTPLTLALSLEFQAIEVDTWLQASSSSPSELTLLAGHQKWDLENNRTLHNLYLDPLMSRLDTNNAGIDHAGGESLVGLYADKPNATVALVIDVKNSPDLMWEYLLEALEPFLDKGYLTTYDTTSGTWSRGPLIIIGTGDTPIPAVYHQETRVIFYDAPLLGLTDLVTIPKTQWGPSATFEWTDTIAPLASSKLPWYYTLAAVMPRCNVVGDRMSDATDEARSRGIKSRWWGVARQPPTLRRVMWGLQARSGVDWMNADDLEEVTEWLGWWNRRHGRQ